MTERLLVKNAKLRDGSVTDIPEDGSLQKIQPGIQIEQADTIDAKGASGVPLSFCDAHLHLTLS